VLALQSAQRALIAAKVGWHVAHDLEGKYGNVDHFLVGPAGVFLLDSKNWAGAVTVANGVATVTPRDNPEAAWTAVGLAKRMRGASVGNKEALQATSGVRTWVHPVVVVWAPFAQRHVISDGIAYVAGDILAAWLSEQPIRLSPAAVSRLGAGVRERLRGADDPIGRVG